MGAFQKGQLLIRLCAYSMRAPALARACARVRTEGGRQVCGSWTLFSAFSLYIWHGGMWYARARVVSLFPPSLQHHYLSSELEPPARCWLVFANDRVEPVAFTARISQCGQKQFREHRTVVLPEWQGLGIGTRLVDEMASAYLRQGLMFYSRTRYVV